MLISFQKLQFQSFLSFQGLSIHVFFCIFCEINIFFLCFERLFSCLPQIGSSSQWLNFDKLHNVAPLAHIGPFYKITKIVRGLWLAERRVCMRVCKYGCGVKMLCFSRANHASTNLKKFLSWKLDTFTLFTHSLVGWDLENLWKHAVSIWFRLSWHFNRGKPVFLESIFISKQELITRTSFVYKTLQLVRISLLIASLNKEFSLFLAKVILYGRHFPRR